MLVWPKLSELDDKIVTEAYEYIVQLVREYNPQLDVDRGALGALWCELHAILHGAVRSILPQLVNALRSELVGQRPVVATSKSGILRLVLSRKRSLTIPVGTVFSDGDKTAFVAEQTYTTAASPSSIISDYVQTAFVELPDSLFGLDVAVHTSNPSARLLLPGDKISCAIPIPGLVRVDVLAPFTENKTVSTRATNARSFRAVPGFVGSASNIRSLLLNNDRFQWISDIAIIGANDAEMRRDNGAGGCVDIYVKPVCPGVDLDSLLAELQAYLNKEAIVCSVQAKLAHLYPVSVCIELDGSADGLCRSAVATALSQLFDARGFNSEIFASNIISAVSPHIPPGVDIRSVTLSSGQLSGSDLAIPEDIEAGITHNTVVMFFDREQLEIVSRE